LQVSITPADDRLLRQVEFRYDHAMLINVTRTLVHADIASACAQVPRPLVSSADALGLCLFLGGWAVCALVGDRPATALADDTKTAAIRAGDWFTVSDWSKAAEVGWQFRDASAGYDGHITIADGKLMLEDDRDGKPDWAEANLPRKLAVADRMVLEFRARFEKLGMADEGTGNQSIMRLSLGVTTPRGPFGASFSFLLDRYNVEAQTHVMRTVDRWHDWRLEIDAGRKTAALFRDGNYVCLHQAGSEQPSGLRLQVQGAQVARARIEIASISLQPAEPHFTTGRRPDRRAKPDVPPGDWPVWRRDLRNTGVSPLVGDMKSAPSIAWSRVVGTQAPAVEIVDLDGDGRDELLVSQAGVLAACRTDGALLWRQPLDAVVVWACDDLDADGERELVVSAGNPRELRILSTRDGRTRYRLPELSKAGVAGIRVAKLDPAKRGLQSVVWSSSTEIGYGLSFEQGVERPSIDWSFNWKKTFFNPCTALADMDRDGRLDLVVLTYNTVFVFDTATGNAKITFDWNSGRNYGTLVVKDIDADGWPDVIVLADVLREHVAVIRNEYGESLKLLWDKFYEQNYPDDRVSLRVLSESADDFDGDGRHEIVYSVCDERAGGRWNTLVVDAVSGEIKQTLSGQYLVGAGPLFPERPAALLLSRPADRLHLETDRLEVWTAQDANWKMAGELPPGTQFAAQSLRSVAPDNWVQVSGVEHGRPTAVMQRQPFDGRAGLLTSLDQGRRAVLFAGDSDGVLHRVWEAKLADHPPGGSIVGLARSEPAAGAGLVVDSGNDGRVRITAQANGHIIDIPFPSGPITTPIVARLRKDELPSILFCDGRSQLHCLRSPAPGAPPKPAWSCPAHGWSTFYVPSLRTVGVPYVADVDGDGHREVLVARDPNLLVALDSKGEVVRKWNFPGRPMQWAVGRFDYDEVPDLIVSYPLGAILDTATVAISGSEGKTLWTSHCGNGAMAVFDLDGDGIDDVILRDLYERRTLDGRTGRDLVPIVMHQGYHSPVLAKLDPSGTPSGIWWLGGIWSLAADSPDGAQLWNHWLAPTGVHAVGDLDGDGQWEIGGVTAGQIYALPALNPVEGPDREFLCHDLTTGRLKWSLPVGTRSVGCITADVDGDGRHEFLLGTADGRLLAVGAVSADAGRVLWEVTLPAAAGVPIVCDADGDGRMDILVSCSDGNLHCLNANGAPVAQGTGSRGATNGKPRELIIEVREVSGTARFGSPAFQLLELPQPVPRNTPFSLHDERGEPVVAQFSPADEQATQAKWWLDFSPHLGPWESRRYTVRYGEGVKPAGEGTGGHRLTETELFYQVTNAPYITWKVPRDLAGLLTSVDFAPVEHLRPESPGLVLRDRDGREHVLGKRFHTGRVLRNGRRAVALRFTGDAKDGPLAGVRSSMDLLFPSPVSWVELDWTIDDPQDRVAGLGSILNLALDAPSAEAPTLVDLGASTWVYARLAADQAAELQAAGSSLDGQPAEPAWKVLRGQVDKMVPFAVAPKSGSRAEGWAHIMDRRRCLALAIDGFGQKADERIRLTANGEVALWRDYAAKPAGSDPAKKHFRFWLHFVFYPPQSSAATSPQMMQTPPEIRIVRP
jgi:outer membrane protein assembly factor BamB